MDQRTLALMLENNFPQDIVSVDDEFEPPSLKVKIFSDYE